METKRWADRKLPTTAARFAFARIAESVALAPQVGSAATRLGLDPLAGTIAVLADGTAWIWAGPTSNSPVRRRCWTSSTP